MTENLSVNSQVYKLKIQQIVGITSKNVPSLNRYQSSAHTVPVPGKIWAMLC